MADPEPLREIDCPGFPGFLYEVLDELNVVCRTLCRVVGAGF